MHDKAKADREYREAHRESIKKYMREYYLKNKEKMDAASKRWQLKNPEKRAQAVRNWRIRHPEKDKKVHREWKKRNPENRCATEARRRARKMGLPYEWTTRHWRVAKDHFHGRCAYCGENDSAMHQDHFIPICSPFCPGTVPWNMVPACADCNTSKGAMMPNEWMDDKSRYAEILEWLELQKHK